MTIPELAPLVFEFVMRDPRYLRLGLKRSAAVVFHQSEQLQPLPEQLAELVRCFWEVFDLNNPDLRGPWMPPGGGGSLYYVKDEMSPWQENAIRALEERDDP